MLVWELPLHNVCGLWPPLCVLCSMLCHCWSGHLLPWVQDLEGLSLSPEVVVTKVMGPEIQMWSSVVAVKYQRCCNGIVPQIQIVGYQISSILLLVGCTTCIFNYIKTNNNINL